MLGKYRSMGGRKGITLAEVIVVIAIILVALALLLPTTQKVRVTGSRMESMNNLKNIGLAIHAFHDARKFLPHNGLSSGGPDPDAASTVFPSIRNLETQSYAFQILPYIEQQAMYNLSYSSDPGIGKIRPLKDSSHPKGYGLYSELNGVSPVQGPSADGHPGSDDIDQRISVFLCPSRGRTGIDAVGRGAQTDYILNPCLNDSDIQTREQVSAAPVSAVNNKVALTSITDGTSNTILCGMGFIQPADYALPAILGGAVYTGAGGVVNNTFELTGIWVTENYGTARGLNKNQAIGFRRDDSGGYSLPVPGEFPTGDPGHNNWGAPFQQGSLMCMADGTVRLFPYPIHDLYQFFTTAGGEKVSLPD